MAAAQNSFGICREKPVAIIGSGVGGLILALQLERSKVPFIIYEARSTLKPTHDVGATVAMAPNCVRLLDNLGVYTAAKALGTTSEHVNIYNNQLAVTETYCVGDEKAFGYPNLRMYRHEVVEVMRQAIVERSDKDCLRYNAKFSHIVSDAEDGVTFELADGTRHSAAVLIGADGIHSKVRGHITDLKPKYTGSFIPLAVIMGRPPMPENKPNFTLPAAFMCKPGSFMIVPQKADMSQTLCFRQVANFPERDRAGWDALGENKEELLAVLKDGIEQWPEYVQSVMKAVKAEHMTMWPIYQLPTLEQWSSKTGRVVVIGDSAHALPPASGQGAAMAVEDGFALALALSAIVNDGQDHSVVLKLWQTLRTDRIEQIRVVANQNSARRLPEAERKAALGKEEDLNGTLESMKWLYNYDLVETVSTRLSQAA